MISLYVLVIYFRPDFVDYFYYRFTTPKSNSLILGASRAAQGIKPEIINKRICTDDKTRIINHAFAGGPSSIGPNYLKEIKQKLNENSIDGLFIISVVPWNFCTSIGNTEDDEQQFFEVRRNLFVGNLKSSSSNPNFEYLWKYWNNKFTVFEHAFKYMLNYDGILQLHPDGWLEVNISMDSVIRENRVINSTNEYKEISLTVKLSDTRFYYFEEIIKYLKERGEIYLIRLPVSKGMAELEVSEFPEFDNQIQKIADKYNIQYINYIKESGKYLTNDTHHLWKDESEKISHQICDSILLVRDKKIF